MNEETATVDIKRGKAHDFGGQLSTDIDPSQMLGTFHDIEGKSSKELDAIITSLESYAESVYESNIELNEFLDKASKDAKPDSVIQKLASTIENNARLFQSNLIETIKTFEPRHIFTVFKSPKSELMKLWSNMTLAFYRLVKEIDEPETTSVSDVELAIAATDTLKRQLDEFVRRLTTLKDRFKRFDAPLQASDVAKDDERMGELLSRVQRRVGRDLSDDEKKFVRTVVDSLVGQSYTELER